MTAVSCCPLPNSLPILRESLPNILNKALYIQQLQARKLRIFELDLKINCNCNYKFVCSAGAIALLLPHDPSPHDRADMNLEKKLPLC